LIIHIHPIYGRFHHVEINLYTANDNNLSIVIAEAKIHRILGAGIAQTPPTEEDEMAKGN